MSDEFSDATEVLKNLFDRLMPDQSEGYTGLFSGWDEIAGPEMSLHVSLKDVANNALILEADHPGWIQRVRMMQTGILREVNSRYPELEIRKLKISVGDGRKNTLNSASSGINPQMVQNGTQQPLKTPSVASDENPSDEDLKFRELLEKMRRRSDS